MNYSEHDERAIEAGAEGIYEFVRVIGGSRGLPWSDMLEAERAAHAGMFHSHIESREVSRACLEAVGRMAAKGYPKS